jgi:Protein of unknown function (DUF3352)
MNHEIDPTPVAPDPSAGAGALQPSAGGMAAASSPGSWLGRYRRLLIPVAGVALVGAVAAAALVLVLKPTPSVEKMVPASVDVYAVVNLDPSVSQKVNLLRALHKFPDTSTDQKLTDLLNKALKDSGITFTDDIQPWLGAQVAVAVRLPKASADPPAAVFAVSKDDAKAQAALTKLRTSSQGQKYAWHDTSYGGITITVGAPSGSSTAKPALKAGAYALIDHVVVIATSEALMHEIIDADQGRSGRLVDAANYKATLAKVPSDRLALLYVNATSIVSNLKSQLTTPMVAGLAGIKGLGDAEAFQGAALALSAGQEGIVADMAIRFDSSKLSATTRDALSHAGHPDAVISWMPSSTDGFLAFGNVNRTIQSLVDQAGSEPSIKQATDSVGLTGSKGILPHLTGDFGVEAELDRSFFPAGAVVLGTDDAGRMRTFFTGLLGLAAQGQGSQPKPLTSTYRGVTITTMAIPGVNLQDHVLPAFAVLDGMGVLASNPTELKAIIDTHKDHSSISKDATYAAAARASIAKPASVFYLDLGKLLKAIKAAPAGSPLAALHLTTSGNLTPLRALIVTSGSGPDGVTERLVVMLQ